MSSFGERLKEERKKKGLSQAQIGSICGIGKSTVSQWENGLRTPGAKTLEKLANYLDVPVDSLLGNIPDLSDAFWFVDSSSRTFKNNLKNLDPISQALMIDGRSSAQTALTVTCTEIEALSIITRILESLNELIPPIYLINETNLSEAIKSFGDTKANIDSLLYQLLHHYISKKFPGPQDVRKEWINDGKESS